VLEREALEGPVNAVAPQPVPQAELARALGRVLRRPALIPVPAFAIRLAMGEQGEALLLASARIRPARLLESGYAFADPELHAALERLVSAPRAR
jgi:NAD dependent epimerase/dehydratase family enzyme